MSCGTIATPKGVLPKYAHDDDLCQGCADPLNVLFESETAHNLSLLLQGITNCDTGKRWNLPSRWCLLTRANNQWVDTQKGCVQQDEQLITGPAWDRFHIRMWDLTSRAVIAGAHHEYLVTLGGNPLVRLHGVDAFDAGRDSVCDDFRANTGKSVTRRVIWMNNYERVPYCSGWAALIS